MKRRIAAKYNSVSNGKLTGLRDYSIFQLYKCDVLCSVPKSCSSVEQRQKRNWSKELANIKRVCSCPILLKVGLAADNFYHHCVLLNPFSFHPIGQAVLGNRMPSLHLCLRLFGVVCYNVERSVVSKTIENVNTSRLKGEETKMMILASKVCQSVLHYVTQHARDKISLKYFSPWVVFFKQLVLDELIC